MRTIADTVREIVASSEPVSSALREGYLNMSAYAGMIRGEVEKHSKKGVKTGSIVIALMRLRASLKQQRPLLPEVLIDDLSLKTGLMEIVFERTEDNLKTLSRLPATKKVFQDCFMVSHGVGEISIIALQSAEGELSKTFSERPRAVMRNLASLTIRYNARYIDTPNSLYVILQNFAARRLNIVEIISTYTEVTIVVAEKDIDAAFHILSGMQKRS